MRRIELLAKQLNDEASEVETQATQRIFTENQDFWQLCMEAYQLLLQEKELNMAEKNEKHNL